MADQQLKIIITFDSGLYKFDAQRYCEVYGSGGWSRWVSYDNAIKDIILKDAMNRIIL